MTGRRTERGVTAEHTGAGPFEGQWVAEEERAGALTGVGLELGRVLDMVLRQRAP